MRKTLLLVTTFIFCVWTFSFLSLHLSASSSCDDLPTNLERYECEYQLSKDKYEQSQQEANAAANNLDEINSQIATVENSIAQLEDDIPALENEIAQTEKEMRAMLQSMQVAKNSNVWINFLTNSSGPEDMMDRILITTNIQQAQTEKMQEMAAQQVLLEQQKETLAAQEQQLVEMQQNALALVHEKEDLAAEDQYQYELNQQMLAECEANPGLCENNNAAVGAFQLPVSDGKVNYTYGVPYSVDYQAVHYGMDFGKQGGSINGQPVYAAGPGTVRTVGYDGNGWGNYVYVVYNYQGYDVGILYAHLSSVYVSQGQSVNSSTAIGAAGSTGLSSGPHLHVEVHTCAAAASTTCGKDSTSAIDGGPGRSNPAPYFGIQNVQGYTWSGR